MAQSAMVNLHNKPLSQASLQRRFILQIAHMAQSAMVNLHNKPLSQASLQRRFIVQIAHVASPHGTFDPNIIIKQIKKKKLRSEDLAEAA
ncbi:MAG: hypothetical protein K6G83_11630 [Lachnospiraceae bacterium]|nr:hypothetical protein [Lachnospiraceae bacterium]